LRLNRKRTPTIRHDERERAPHGRAPGEQARGERHDDERGGRLEDRAAEADDAQLRV
jgi:hypothetical protein